MPRQPKAPADPEKQLKIKIKSCERLQKEVTFYEKEVQENEAKLQRMRAENRDAHDIKKFEEVLGESYMMIPDSRARWQRSLQDLREFLETQECLESATETVTAAKTLLQESDADNKTTKKEEAEAKESEAKENFTVETDVSNVKEGEAF